jgi:hypothetical protein
MTSAGRVPRGGLDILVPGPLAWAAAKDHEDALVREVRSVASFILAAADVDQ